MGQSDLNTQLEMFADQLELIQRFQVQKDHKETLETLELMDYLVMDTLEQKLLRDFYEFLKLIPLELLILLLYWDM